MSLRTLLGPYELLDLPDQGRVTLRIQTWERGLMTIRTRGPGAPEEKEIEVLRLHLPPGVKPYPPNYWDITSKTLMAQFLPHLLQPMFERYEYIVTKYGIAPRARFTLERVPLG